MKKTVLEVIACSVADAVAAEKGGADRLEIVSDLACGGFTPSRDLVREIKAAVALPLRVMLRECVGYEVKSVAEFNALCAAARDFERLGVDGVVVGFLRDMKIDLELTSRVLGCAPTVKATFHHAFEDSDDKLGALKAIQQLRKVDRVLSSGGSGDLKTRINRLTRYQTTMKPPVEIIVGGGVDSGNISSIKGLTGIREFHVGRAAREGFKVTGVVKTELVAGLIELIDR